MILLGRAHLCLAAALVSCLYPSRAEDAARYGFGSPEIFPIDNLVTQLRVADLDGDGLNDLVVVNNSRSKINLLYNQTGKSNLTARAQVKMGKRELNELPPDARFRIESIASEKRIAALVVDDLNGDGRPDIAYYGEPKELVVLYNEGSNHWSSPKRFAIDDGQLTPNALCSGDLNGDQRTDLVLLGENCVYLLAQKADHSLAEPEKIPFTGTVRSVQLADVDGDGRSDLLLVNWEDKNPFRFRRQKPDGQLGPELYFENPAIRSYWADNLDGGKKAQVVTIAQNSGRAEIAEFMQRPGDSLSGSFQAGQFQVWPLSRTEKAKRGLLWADVNGDGLPDLLIAEPEMGQISICFGEKDGSLASAVSFPSLAGVSDLAVADWEGDGHPEIFMLSADERQVGVARLDDHQRLPFPKLIQYEGRPLVLAVGKLRDNEKSVLAVVVDRDGKRTLVTRNSDRVVTTQKLSEDFKATPTTMAFHDVDQDGLPDLVILTPYERVKVLRQQPEGSFEEIDVAPPGGVIEQPWMSAVDVDGDGKQELLLTQRNFVRAVVLKKEGTNGVTPNDSAWSFVVKEQINGMASNSRLAGAAALNGTNAISSLFLLDVEHKVLTLCERGAEGAWKISRNLPLPVSDFATLQSIALGGKELNAIAFLGLNSAACLPLSGDVWDLKALDGYETPVRDGHLNDVVAGDLNNDGRKELVFLETGRNYLDLVAFDSHRKLVPANRWQVFEERTFRSRRNDIPEPREAAIADVTGDGKNDLIVLVHDRILVYPQE